MKETSFKATIVSHQNSGSCPEEFRWEFDLVGVQVHGFAPDYETAVKNLLQSLEDWLIPVDDCLYCGR